LSVTNKNVSEHDPFAHEECRAIADILTLIGDKWTVLVVGALSHGSMRYSDILKQIEGISQRMLTLTVRNLERDGLVLRTQYPTIPPRVDYMLTERGQTLVIPLNGLWAWAQQNRAVLSQARREFDKGD
jgi:DNA-binding HxlR family transcriptional regulator